LFLLFLAEYPAALLRASVIYYEETPHEIRGGSITKNQLRLVFSYPQVYYCIGLLMIYNEKRVINNNSKGRLLDYVIFY